MIEEQDPWLADDDFTGLDTRTREEVTASLNKVIEEHPELAPTAEEVEAADGVVESTDAPSLVPEIITNIPANQPEVIELQDGSIITIERTATEIKATLDPQTGAGVEVFHARNDAELNKQLLIAKLNATKKINRQEKQIRLGTQPPVPVTPTESPIRELTADEIFQYKTLQTSDPIKALDFYFEKRTGKTIAQIATDSERGANADDEVYSDTQAKSFRAQRPEYFTTDENYYRLLATIAKKAPELKGLVVTGDFENLISSLIKKRLFNAENLCEAYDELSEAGLLDLAPETQPAAPAPVPTPVVQPATITATPQSERIVRSVRRPRASLGIPQSATTVVAPAGSERGPSAEELDDLPFSEIENLIKGVRRVRAGQAPR